MLYVIPVQTGKTAKDTAWVVHKKKPRHFSYAVDTNSPREAKKVAKARHKKQIDQIIDRMEKTGELNQVIRRATT